MQLQFEKKGISFLQTVKREVQSQEQTQELRVSDGMPDIGSIVGAWGQVILRSKEWQGDGMTISGGTMVWVQYIPEEGGEAQCVESWLPFQMRWSFPQTQHDGTIIAQSLLRSVDARSLSARKMMIRANVSVLGMALEKQQRDIFVPSDVPEDIQLNVRRYPIQLPAEAGEKTFSLDESVSLPPSAPRMEKLVSYCVQPEITEERMMGDKVVFRGNALLHMLYCGDDGGEYSWDFDLPFTQYCELDGEYGEEASVLLLPNVTALELERDEDDLNLKVGLVCQYRIDHRPVVEVVEDAYSILRSVTPVYQDLQLPGILESRTQKLRGQLSVPMDAMRLTDVQALPQPVQIHSNGQEAALEVSSQFQMLYYDMDGGLHTASQKWQENVILSVGEDCGVEALSWPVGKTQGNLLSGNAQLTAEMKLLTETRSSASIPMVTGLELGELQEPDPHRPSLILRRKGSDTLWEMAKRNGSTVKAIEAANQLETDPDPSRMLLIPVI